MHLVVPMWYIVGIQGLGFVTGITGYTGWTSCVSQASECQVDCASTEEDLLLG